MEARRVEHFVLFNLKDTLSSDELQAIQDQLSVIRSAVPGVLDASFGQNITPGRNKGYNYGLRVLMDRRETLPVYAVHEEHVKLVQLLKAATEGEFSPLCVDWEL